MLEPDLSVPFITTVAPPACPTGLGWVRKCMRIVFHHVTNLARLARPTSIAIGFGTRTTRWCRLRARDRALCRARPEPPAITVTKLGSPVDLTWLALAPPAALHGAELV